ncbi:type VII toxin-antitoxin system HepT family RNase toxin [Solicola gregarius]|uniref:DUF86 domain-containing protein n=1 Tax=Solicola gregarius TaxID=2908642 RepID=A0AA46TFF1_9ACTN|nr:DUF86 domain-containing protein [Solicola gregarius]UYM04344.1 DUF86 domain-containing protein [Solicola gregarius]
MADTLAALESAGDVDAARLTSDPLVGAAVERLLSRIVDLAVDVNSHVAAVALRRSPGDYRESFDLAAEAGALTTDLAETLKPSVGLRNAIVHEYVHTIVGSAVPLALKSYAEDQRQIAGFVLDRSG